MTTPSEPRAWRCRVSAPGAAVGLAGGAGFCVLEVAGFDTSLSVEEEDIDDLGGDVIVGLQVFLGHLLLRHARLSPGFSSASL